MDEIGFNKEKYAETLYYILHNQQFAEFIGIETAMINLFFLGFSRALAGRPKHNMETNFTVRSYMQIDSQSKYELLSEVVDTYSWLYNFGYMLGGKLHPFKNNKEIIRGFGKIIIDYTNEFMNSDPSDLHNAYAHSLI